MYVARDCLKGKREGAELSKKVVALRARLWESGVCIEEGRERVVAIVAFRST